MQRNVKQLPGSFQERRRAQALEKQKSARRQATDRARKLALGADDAEDVSQEPQQVRGAPWRSAHLSGGRRRRRCCLCLDAVRSLLLAV